MPGNYFIVNKEIIGLMMIYSIAMLLAVCILDLIFSWIKSKLVTKKKTRKVVRKISEFDKAVEKARVSSQIRVVMNTQL